MRKTIKIIGYLSLGMLLAAGCASCSLDDITLPWNDDKLPTVRDVVYDYPSDALTWEDISGATYYNLDIDGKIETVKGEYYKVNLDRNATGFTVKIQACDDKGWFSPSDWSEPFVVTVDQKDIVNRVDRYAQSIPGNNMDLEKVVAMHAVDNVLYTTAVFRDLGKNYIYTYNSAYNDPVASLSKALDMGVPDTTHTENYNLAKDYDTASYFLAREEKSEKMQELADAGYEASFMTSQAFQEDTSMVGIKGILKAVNKHSSAEKYYSVDFAIEVGLSNIEGYKYTTAVKNVPVTNIFEDSFVELTGDFVDYAKAVEARQSENNVPNGLAMA